MTNIIVRTVGELIASLQRMDQSKTVISHEPPFTGVQLVDQHNGKVLIASLWNTDEGRAGRKVNKARQFVEGTAE